MKSMFQIPLCILALLGLSGPSSAHASIAPALSVSSVRGFTDRNAELSLFLNRATNTTAFQFDLSFNPLNADRLPPIWSELLSNHVVRTHELKPGTWRTLIYSPSKALLRPNMAVANLPFHIPVAERNGSGPITPSGFVLARMDATVVDPVSTRAGRIFVTQVSPPDPDGSISIFFPVTKPADYVLFASADFAAWTAISTNAASGNIVDFMDRDAVRYPHRFYFMSEADTRGPTGVLPGPEFSLNGTDGTLRIASPALGKYQIEASIDLRTWAVVSEGTNSTGNIEVFLPNLKSSNQRFFRLRPD